MRAQAQPILSGSASQSEAADLDVAESDRVAMVLQSDVAAPCAAEAREVLELALADPPLPVRGPQLVIHHLHAVQPMLDMRAPHEQARLVPRTDRLRRVA